MSEDIEAGDEVVVEEEAARLALAPDEIINYPLRKATRGYRTDEVDDLLDQLAVQTQDMLAEMHRLEDERDRLRQQLAEASETESMLKKTLVTAQRAAEASVAEAREEADELRRRARQRVEELVAEAAEQAHELREAALRRARADEADIRRYRRDVEEHIEALRTFAGDHRARLARHLELQLDRLAEMDLPEAPPEPEMTRDEVLDVDVPDVDVAGIVDELAGPESDSTGDEEQAGTAPAGDQDDVGEHADRGASDPGSHEETDAEVDTSETLFES